MLWCHIRHLRLCQRDARCARLIATSPGRHRDRALPSCRDESGTSGAPWRRDSCDNCDY
ncbi:Uncharacterised protein [Mycobacterium tuberculosis]|nr:Uncharacterised protein [Mycobacterium tuberculosis]